MRILLTNDDGIDAPGLAVLGRALADAGHDLVVAAPATDRSGTGSGLGTIEDGAEIAVTEHQLPDLPGVSATAFDAPPSFAVLAACTGVLGPRPDLVVSGINDGFNTGRLLLTSSTVGAALNAGSLGVRGLAISAGFAPDHRFDTAAQVAVSAVEWLIEHAAPRTVLNVNVPNLGIEEVKGVRMAALAPRGLMGLRLNPTAGAIRLERFANTEGLGEETDAALVQAGYVAISVLPSVSRAADPAGNDPAAAVEAALALPVAH
ncbi:5'/3'-nucleotidase SurE [Nocardioides sp. AE5]|uniref:5'/3'-nucleotidase SurE n=1 Tax=Nocardioides sp. AE5 TaxID=2962573 RepID=UPI002880EA99|nr:5'/3'-nucleotidase SurE [Nocardioides sp. AE5]MDT0201666.1 5'/3'-nucleotidase SurE [Nocardioides sp. AE5]